MKRFGSSDAGCAGYLKMLAGRITERELRGVAVNLTKSELSKIRENRTTTAGIKTYTTALHVCKHWKCWDSAKEILSMMKSDNVRATRTVVELAARSSRTVTEATSALKELKEWYPIQSSDFPTPNISAHLAMLILNKQHTPQGSNSDSSAAQIYTPINENRQAAMSLLQNIPRVKMTQNCWQALLHCQKDLQSALKVLQQLPDHQKSLQCYNILLIHCRGAVNGKDAAEAIMIEIKNKKGSNAPNRVSWNRLLKVYVDSGTLEECFNCFQRKMYTSSVSMDSGDVSYLLTSCSNDIMKLKSADPSGEDAKSCRRAKAVASFAESIFQRLELMGDKNRSKIAFLRLLVVYHCAMQYVPSPMWSSKCISLLALYKSRHLIPTPFLFKVASDIQLIVGPIGLIDILNSICLNAKPDRIPTISQENNNIRVPFSEGIHSIK